MIFVCMHAIVVYNTCVLVSCATVDQYYKLQKKHVNGLRTEEVFNVVQLVSRCTDIVHWEFVLNKNNNF